MNHDSHEDCHLGSTLASSMLLYRLAAGMRRRTVAMARHTKVYGLVVLLHLSTHLYSLYSLSFSNIPVIFIQSLAQHILSLPIKQDEVPTILGRCRCNYIWICHQTHPLRDLRPSATAQVCSGQDSLSLRNKPEWQHAYRGHVRTRGHNAAETVRLHRRQCCSAGRQLNCDFPEAG